MERSARTPDRAQDPHRWFPWGREPRDQSAGVTFLRAVRAAIHLVVVLPGLFDGCIAGVVVPEVSATGWCRKKLAVGADIVDLVVPVGLFIPVHAIPTHH